MTKLLLPVDGSESALRAVAFAIKHLHPGRGDEIHLLSVQLPIHSGFANHEHIERYQRGEAEQALAGARQLLAQHGLRYLEHIAVGQIGETIAHYATTQGVDQIVMGSRGLGTVGGLVMGSVAVKVVHLAHCPVTLVK
jgi:nucleotide-binding universal stress UspA family protein